MTHAIGRREFIATGVGFWVHQSLARGQEKSPHEKLNVACIGVGGRGAASVDAVAQENIVALCDVDERTLGKAAQKHARARKFFDFRKMLEEGKDIDAVTIGTPDHIHAPATLLALSLGKHVYCEKPLTHTVGEARRVAEAAARAPKLVTQMGNQLHSTENVIRPAEILLSGVLGPVREAHSWSDKVFAPGDRPKESMAIPAGLDWDVWLGPAPERPYHKAYHPFHWRGWWDFGGGNLADMACHILDPIFWGLKLRYPSSVEAEGIEPHPESSPPWRVVRYEFPERDGQPALAFTWYDGGRRPPAELHEGVKLPGQGSLVIGEKARMLLSHGAGYKIFGGTVTEPEKTLPRPEGHDHHRDWIHGIKNGRPAGSRFEYAGPLTEVPLLGNAAYRARTRIAWDAGNLKAKGSPEAGRFIHKEYRKGWELA